jgi:hypothetical protein
VVLANWAVQQAGKDAERRLALKWDLMRRLYEIGLQKADILELWLRRSSSGALPGYGLCG